MAGHRRGRPLHLRLGVIAGWTAARGTPISSPNATVDHRLKRRERRIWEIVARSPLESLWNVQGVPVRVVAVRTWKALMCDRVFGHAAELGFYFLFAPFPNAALRRLYPWPGCPFGLPVLRQAAGLSGGCHSHGRPGHGVEHVQRNYGRCPTGKVTFGLISAIWSASVGISAIQDTLNAVYKIENSRSYIVARIQAIGLTILLTFVVTLGLASMLGGDSRRRGGNYRVAAGFSRAARLPAFFQQLHRDVWVLGGGHHPADMVLHHRVYAAARGRDQRADRSRRRRENPAGANGWFGFVPGRAV